MSYDEEKTKRSRVVVETPTERREVIQHQTVRYPEERRGFSTGMVVTVALLAIAATAIIFLFLTNSRGDSETNVNIRTSATQPTPMTQTPVIVSQPATQPTPIIITQPAPVTQQPAPVIIQAPPASTTTTNAPPATTAPAAPAHDDASLQTKLDKALTDDTELSAAGVTATIINGRASLTGNVNSDALKRKAERLAYAIKGVTGVDNHITVTP
ncbi:MAG: BON domain-containing protein [Pyrinomonadaceae bacterium]